MFTEYYVPVSSALIALVVLILLTAATCEPIPDPEIPDDTADCAAAYVNLKDLGCVEATLPDGTTFQAYCEDVQEDGHALNPSCLKTIKGCDEISLVCGQ